MSGLTPLIVLALIPFLFWNRAFLIPTIIILPFIEKGFPNNFFLSAETLAMILIAPKILADNLKSPKVDQGNDLKIKIIFGLFLTMVIFGTFVALYSFYEGLDEKRIISNNLKVVVQLIYFYMLFRYISKLGIQGVMEGLSIMRYCTGPLIIGVLIFLVFKGTRIGKDQYFNFGYMPHGTFTASMVCISSFAFYYIFIKSRSYLRLFYSISIVTVAIIIIYLSASRNGVVSIIMMTMIAFLVIRGLHFSHKRLLIGALMTISFAILIGTVWNKPEVIQRREKFVQDIDLDEFSSHRILLYSAGIKGFLEKPVTGQGAHNSISRAYSSKVVEIDNVIHNTILEIAFQYGIIGLIPYVLLQVLIIRGYFRLRRYVLMKREDQSILLIPFMAYFSLLVSSLFVSWIWYTFLWYHVSIVLAIIYIVPDRKKELIIDPSPKEDSSSTLRIVR